MVMRPVLDGPAPIGPAERSDLFQPEPALPCPSFVFPASDMRDR